MSDELRIDLHKLTMKELQEIRGVTGRSLMAELVEVSVKCLDEQMMPALVWIARRRSEPELTYDQVCSTLEWGELGKDGSVVIDLGGTPPLSEPGTTTRRRSRPSAGSTTSPPAI